MGLQPHSKVTPLFSMRAESLLRSNIGVNESWIVWSHWAEVKAKSLKIEAKISLFIFQTKELVHTVTATAEFSFILVSSNVDVANGFWGTKLQCSYDNVIFKTRNCRCRRGVNKTKRSFTLRRQWQVFFKHFHMSLPPRCEHCNWSP